MRKVRLATRALAIDTASVSSTAPGPAPRSEGLDQQIGNSLPESKLRSSDAILPMASDTLERRARDVAVLPMSGGSMFEPAPSRPVSSSVSSRERLAPPRNVVMEILVREVWE
jgi:hypothetical protein